MTDDALLALERYAEALAYQRIYPATDHPAVLAKLAIAEDAFARAHDVWPRQMATTLQAGDASMHLTFARVYNEVESRLRLVRPKLEAIRPQAGLETANRRAAVRQKGLRPLPRKPASEAEPARAVATAVPTYLQPHRQGEAAAPPVEAYVAPEDIDVDETGALDPRRLGAAIMPFLQGLPAPPPPRPPEPPRPMPGAPHPDPTEELSAEALARVVSPFVAAAPRGAPPPRGAASAVDEGGPDETMQLPAPVAAVASPIDPEPMTLERYAAVSAELASGEQAEVLARLGIKRETWVRAMTDMAARFKAEPDLEARYRALMRGLLGISRPG